MDGDASFRGSSRYTNKVKAGESLFVPFVDGYIPHRAPNISILHVFIPSRARAPLPSHDTGTDSLASLVPSLFARNEPWIVISSQ